MKIKWSLWFPVTLVLFFVLFITGKATDSPSFCGSCHYMKPFYENWQSSSHARVNCNKCHYAKGFRGYIRGKMALLGEMTKYYTHTYTLTPHARIEDENCLTCHPFKKLGEKIAYRRNIPFRHQSHYDKVSRGIRLRCTSCHSELVQGSHTAVTESSCFYCHFIGVAFRQPLSECNTCHGSPAEEILLQGMKFSHSKFLKTGVDCLTCHVEVVSGAGDVPQEKCRTCHIQRELAWSEAQKLHQVHVTQQSVKCNSCHTDLTHGKTQMLETLYPECRSCHGPMHTLQEQIYMGTFPIGGEEPLPDPMFLSGVNCTACHLSQESMGISQHPRKLARASPSACLTCHPEGFNQLLTAWQNDVQSEVQNLEKFVDFLGRVTQDEEIPRNSQKTMRPKELKEIQQVLHSIRQDGSWGAHNIRLTFHLLSFAYSKISEEYSRVSVPPFQPLPETRFFISLYGCNESCHVGVERKSVLQKEWVFPHDIHLFKASLDCNTCHSTEPVEASTHGKSLLTASSCSSCHHSAKWKRTCVSCHPVQAQMYSGSVWGENSPDAMQSVGITCEMCHQNEQGEIIRFSVNSCLSCHENSSIDEMRNKQQTIRQSLKMVEQNLTMAQTQLLSEKGKSLLEHWRNLYTLKEILEWLKKDGSWGAHNLILSQKLLERIHPPSDAL